MIIKKLDIINNSVKTVAIIHWGDVFEDFLDSINVSFDNFCNHLTGGWMFGYVEALKSQGIHTVIFCISARILKTETFVHKPTGATICVLPVPKLYKIIRIKIPNPYGRTIEESCGNYKGVKRLLLSYLKDVSPYTATPIITFYQQLKKFKCEALICQEYEYARFDICVLLGSFIKIPVFACFQGGDFQTSRLEKYFRPVTIRSCTGLIIATQKEILRVKTIYSVPKDKIAKIFNPITIIKTQTINKTKLRSDLNLPINSKIVIYHGRISIYRKGLDILLDAWTKLYISRKEKNLLLLIIGTGGDASILRSKIAQEQIQGIKWIDQYINDRNLIQQYLHAADLYVLSSRHEGFPVAPIEALASGIPVIASDAPGISDILEDGENSGGIIIPLEDVLSLYTAINNVLDNEVWRIQLGHLARVRAENFFSTEAIGKQLLNFIYR